jgi:hypothetical protein
MSRIAKAAGTTLLAVGLAVLVGFSLATWRDERFRKAALQKERNPGNVMYEGQYFAAFTIRTFLVSGAICGALLALNGSTLLLLGVVAGRQEKANGTAVTDRSS